MNTKVTFRRIMAYILDMFIIIIVTSMFASIEKLNPNYEKYDEIYKEYMEYSLNVTNVEDLKSDVLADYSYNLSYYGLSTTIITLVITILYFGLFQYYNDGKTIGKALWNIEVKTTDNKKVSLPCMLLRSGLVNSTITSALSIIAILALKRAAYDKVSLVIQFIDLGIIFAIVALILFRDDRRGFHDVICKTQVQKVVADAEVKEEIKEAKVVEKTTPKKTVKKSTTKKTTKKVDVKNKEEK